jgi:membrane protein DedA with SNARE-associated domain
MAARGMQFLGAMRRRRTFQVSLVVALILATIILLALLEGDLPELFRFRGWKPFFKAHGYLFGILLLYIEESGIPLPAPGDVFVMFVGAHVPRNLLAWVGAWLGLVATVVLGATNLFFISRKVGRQLVESRVADFVHLTPKRMAKAEAWFARYGVLAIIFGRHVPGFRVPITVAAGILHVRWQVFAASVAISTAIWAGIFLVVGIKYGSRFENFLRLHSSLYFVWGGIIALLIIGHFVRRRINRMRAKPPTMGSQSVGESAGR